MPDTDPLAQVPQVLPVFGHLEAFEPEKEPWESYFERFEQFVVVNGVSESRQVACLLSAIGAETYGVLRNL